MQAHMQKKRKQVKIFGIGAHKTGTTSLCVALNMLGFKCSHWDEHLLIREDIENSNYRLRVLEEFDAITDFPMPSIYQRLDEEFPGSKFILTIRDSEAWVTSVEAHLIKSSNVLNRNGLSFIFEEELFYGTKIFDRKKALEKLTEHHEAVISYFAGRQNDLLKMDITRGDGWGVLCEFLDVPEPADSFPHKRL